MFSVLYFVYMKKWYYNQAFVCLVNLFVAGKYLIYWQTGDRHLFHFMVALS